MRRPSATSPGTRGARTGAQRGRRVMRVVAPPVVVLGVVVGVWYLVSYVALDPSRRFLLPPLHAVVQTAFLTTSNLDTLAKALGTTAEVAMLGLGIAGVIGLSVAVVMSQARSLERAVYPYLVVLQTVPILAIVPLIGFWLGFGLSARLVVCVLISIFPIIANAHFGLRSPTGPQTDLFVLNRAGRLTRLVKLELPAALPAILAGFRISAGLSVIGEIVGAFFFQRGPIDLGILLDVYVSDLDGPMLFGTIILSSALGVAVFWVFSSASNLVVGRWKE